MFNSSSRSKLVPLSGCAERHGAAEIGEVRRQAEPWMREATRMFATGCTAEAVAAYSTAGMVHAVDTRDVTRTALIDRWDAERQASPAASRIILTHMNTEVAMLNHGAGIAGHLPAQLSLPRIQRVVADAEPMQDLRYRIISLSGLDHRITLGLIAEI